MKTSTRQHTRLLAGAATTLAIVALAVTVGYIARAQGHPKLATEEDFRRAMRDLSNDGRWGKDDDKGTANFITPAKRKQAAALVKDGIAVSLAHRIPQEGTGSRLVRTLGPVRETGTADAYALTGTYHGSTFSHMDAIDCHVMFEGKGYNGVSQAEVQAANGCPKGDIDAERDGFFTRGILFDATLLPGKGTPEGWVEPGVAIHLEDLEALEKVEHVRVGPGDVILLYTGRWKREAAKGVAQEHAGYHADVAYFLKDRSVAGLAHDHIQDVGPTGFPQAIGNPLHKLALAAMGMTIFDNLDLERAADVAREKKRYEFLFTVAPWRVEKGTGSPVNPLAVF